MHEASREYKYFLLNVFTNRRLQGNSLAVFPEAHGLSDAQMQSIAQELNLSETVFLTPPGSQGVARARIYTPLRELDFAGHPTIGSAFLLARLKGIRTSFAIEENVGLISIDVTREGSDSIFWLTTPPISFFETLESAFCARLLGVEESDLAPVTPQFVSAGSPVLFIALKDQEAVDRAKLNPAHLAKALGSVNSVGTFTFALKAPTARAPFDVYSRMFAPQSGIPEDPATGGATGPLAAYMLEHGLATTKNGRCEFSSEQGRKMGRRSLLRVKVSENQDNRTIKVGGCTVMTAEGMFTVDV